MVIAKAGCFNLFCPRIHKQIKALLDEIPDGLTGRRALNGIELAQGILLREEGIHIAIRDFIGVIEIDADNTLPRPSGRCRGQTGQ
jgi:hypothetical protein